VAVAMTTATSLFFYAWWKPAFVLLPMASIICNFWLARQIQQADQKAARVYAIVGVVANLMVLGYFKYFDFLISIFEQRNPGITDVPLALSFTTFVQIAFLVETYRHPEAHPLPRYAMFVSFFPHLIAGPIVRWSELGPQLADASRYRFNWESFACGITIFFLGLAKRFCLRIIWPCMSRRSSMRPHRTCQSPPLRPGARQWRTRSSSSSTFLDTRTWRLALACCSISGCL
jgi:D-alanyl-lipoteichoic acid acyltransferase DltB (MBOAT superfamily)